MSAKYNPRVVAAKILAAVTKGQSLNSILSPQLETLEPTKRPLVRELVFGSLREWPRLAALVALRLRKPLKAKDSDVLALLVLGIYQLTTTRIATHAAVSETVEAARKLGKPWASGLVNGVLRGFLRDWEALSSDELEAALSPAQRGALSDWLWCQIDSEWPEQREAIVAASRSRPPMTLRVNLSRTTRDAYQQALEHHNLSARPSATVASALTLETPVDVGALPGFDQGDVSVQDESAQLAAWLLDPKAGEQLLDACAAPGGKSCHLLELAPKAILTATDISNERLERVRENAQRLQLNMTLCALDASIAEQTLSNQRFDAILADVPCSATGVIRRNPDVKLLRQAEDIDRFVAQQRGILQGLWPLLRPGGRLLYVTCSILAAENDTQVAWALENLPGATVATLPDIGGVATPFGVQRLPCADGGDGLYFASLQRAE